MRRTASKLFKLRKSKQTAGVAGGNISHFLTRPHYLPRGEGNTAFAAAGRRRLAARNSRKLKRQHDENWGAVVTPEHRAIP